MTRVLVQTLEQYYVFKTIPHSQQEPESKVIVANATERDPKSEILKHHSITAMGLVIPHNSFPEPFP